MITKGPNKPDFASQVKGILDKEPGLSVKELAERLKTNRQYMAGILKVLEERGRFLSVRLAQHVFITPSILQRKKPMVIDDRVNVERLIKESHVDGIKRNLLEWWSCVGHRHFPWRETHDPFKVLVAEILLHRTRAEQIVPMYHLFLEKYPDLHSITVSSPDELAVSFRSVGLHWRWKLLHSMAVEIETRFNGQIPRNFEDLTSLPGISHYIASAVRCFAFGYPDILLDTNTVRVTGRVFGLPITDSSRRSPLFRHALEQLKDLEHPREFNFALIDFAAKVCRPKPIHEQCPVTGYCLYYNVHRENK